MSINVEQDLFFGNRSILESGFSEARFAWLVLIYNQSSLNATLNATISSIPICSTLIIHVAGKLLMKEYAGELGAIQTGWIPSVEELFFPCKQTTSGFCNWPHDARRDCSPSVPA